MAGWRLSRDTCSSLVTRGAKKDPDPMRKPDWIGLLEDAACPLRSQDQVGDGVRHDAALDASGHKMRAPRALAISSTARRPVSSA